jgi:hypothetical protein
MQTVPARFSEHAEGQVRRISYALRMSLAKQYNASTTFFTLDASQLDGPDVLQPDQDNVLQQWDHYDYRNFTDRLVSMEWTRELEFPDSVICAMADFTFENHDGYFTPLGDSPVAHLMLPSRPVRLLAGFAGVTIPQFVGLTEKRPDVDEAGKTVSFHAIDFLSQIFSMPLNKTIAMQKVRTDQVLAAIFDQFGLAPEQYDLPVCRNVIPFVFYERDKLLAGEVIRDLMQAEMGNLWLDERGIIRLDPRISGDRTPLETLDESKVVDIKATGSSAHINMVKIFADLRAVQDFQPVFTKTASDTDLFVVGAGQAREFEADLQDPALSIVTPTFGIGTGPSWFTAALPDGSPVTSGITVTAYELRTNTYVFTVSNANTYSVNIDQVELWGQPAKVIDHIEYTEVDQDSIDKYDEQVLEIHNNFIQSISQCDSLAQMILVEFSEPASEVEITVKANPARQLGDLVNVAARSYNGPFKITKTFNRIQASGYTQVLTARRATIRSWFVLDQSLLNSEDVLTP